MPTIGGVGFLFCVKLFWGISMKKLRVLWACCHALHDTSSGASLSLRVMINQLLANSFEVASLSGYIFSADSGKALFPAEVEDMAPKRTFTFSLDGIVHTYMRFHTTIEGQIYQAEMGAFLQQYLKALDTVHPDLIITYGGGVLDMALQTEAQRRGIPVIFSLVNSNYTTYNFHGITAIITDSSATADFYLKRSILNVQSVGVFIDSSRVIEPKRVANRVCMVNVGGIKDWLCWLVWHLWRKKGLRSYNF